MKAIDIINAMCQNGTTEQMGVFSPVGELEETISTYFGDNYRCIKSSVLFHNVDYLYVYGERLPNDTGETSAEFVLMNEHNEFIYIYEIEL